MRQSQEAKAGLKLCERETGLKRPLCHELWGFQMSALTRRFDLYRSNEPVSAILVKAPATYDLPELPQQPLLGPVCMLLLREQL